MYHFNYISDIIQVITAVLQDSEHIAIYKHNPLPHSDADRHSVFMNFFHLKYVKRVKKLDNSFLMTLLLPVIYFEMQ